MEKLALRMNEAVSIAGLSRSKLYQEIKEGRLKAVKAGGRRLILRSDLEDYFSKASADSSYP